MKRFGTIVALVLQVALAVADQFPSRVDPPPTNAVVGPVRTPRDVPAARVQCEAITKSGKRCSRKAVPGEKFCRQHLARTRQGEKAQGAKP